MKPSRTLMAGWTVETPLHSWWDAWYGGLRAA